MTALNCVAKSRSTASVDAKATIAVLLVGGLGTRLRSVLASTPKPLAPIGKIPFLELLIGQLQSQGIRHLVMSTGYLAEQIEQQFGDGQKWGAAIEYSRESRPLGTAGAVKFAKRYLMDASDFLVLNGDSFLELDFHQLVQFHREHVGLITIAVRRVSNAARYGTVSLGTHKRIVAFNEKTGRPGPGIVNAGVYVFNRAVLAHIPDGPCSLEKDIFPTLTDRGLYAVEQQGTFIDIGTPEDYARAQELGGRLARARLSEQLSR